MFLAVKQESSGYPSNVKSTSDEDQYIKNYFENEGVILNKDRIKLNPGMRAVSKLMLNSFWGR